MTRLEDLQPTAALRGILPEEVVTVVSVQWFGSEALELTYKGASGRVANELLYRHDEPRFQVLAAAPSEFKNTHSGVDRQLSEEFDRDLYVRCNAGNLCARRNFKNVVAVASRARVTDH